MAKKESVQKRLQKVRPPRVQLTYDVEIGDAIEVKELPLGVDIEFRKFEDFRPESVVQQVEPLRKLQEARSKLADLRNKLAGNEKLEDLLNDVLSSTEQLHSLGGKKSEGELQ